MGRYFLDYLGYFRSSAAIKKWHPFLSIFRFFDFDEKILCEKLKHRKNMEFRFKEASEMIFEVKNRWKSTFLGWKKPRWIFDNFHEISINFMKFRNFDFWSPTSWQKTLSIFLRKVKNKKCKNWHEFQPLNFMSLSLFLPKWSKIEIGYFRPLKSF